jgi:putative membrane protein
MDRHFRHHLRPPIRVGAERLALLGGVGLLAVAVTPMMRAVAETSLTAHMVQHVVLLQIAPLLIVCGWPITDARRDSRGRARTRLVVVAWIVGVAAMTLWYAPPLFAWMMRSPLHHAVAQVTLVVAGILFWSPIFSRCTHRRLPAGLAIAYLFTACLTSTLAGASIAFAAPALYGDHVASAFDQQIAGLIMWLPCCVVYVAAIMTTLARWYGGGDEIDDRRPSMAPSQA